MVWGCKSSFSSSAVFSLCSPSLFCSLSRCSLKHMLQIHSVFLCILVPLLSLGKKISENGRAIGHCSPKREMICISKAASHNQLPSEFTQHTHYYTPLLLSFRTYTYKLFHDERH